MGPIEECLTVMILRPGLIPRSAGLDLALSGIRRAISSSHSRRSGTCRAPMGSKTHRQADVMSMSHHSGLGLEPTHLLLSQRLRGLHTARLPECLRCLVTIRPA